MFATKISIYLMVVATFWAITSAYPLEEYSQISFDEDLNELVDPLNEEAIVRARRSLQPGAPNYPGNGDQGNKPRPGWELNPNINRDDRGNTRTRVDIQHRGENHDFNAGWGKTIRGPEKAKPVFNVGGSYRWD